MREIPSSFLLRECLGFRKTLLVFALDDLGNTLENNLSDTATLKFKNTLPCQLCDSNTPSNCPGYGTTTGYSRYPRRVEGAQIQQTPGR
jgi:hypothetical protein